MPEASLESTPPDAGPPGPLVAIVTGASAGIGLAIAHALAKDGYALVVTARSEDRLNDAARALADDSDAPVLPIVVDSSNPADMDDLVGATVEQFGRLDVIVNNAGVAHMTPIEASDSAAFLESYILNVFAPAALIRAAWPRFKEAGRGTVVNVSSWAARDPYPGFFIYGSSKAALASLARSCVNDAKSEGFEVRAFSICPGAVETDLLRSVVDETACPPEYCLQPQNIGTLAAACVRGELDEHNGAEIYIRKDAGGQVQIEIPSFLG